MANDERDGDELFEDLDKFFAPIRDVDWDEPDEPAATAPAEEHVAVRTEQSARRSELPEDAAEPPPERRRRRRRLVRHRPARGDRRDPGRAGAAGRDDRRGRSRSRRRRARGPTGEADAARSDRVRWSAARGRGGRRARPLRRRSCEAAARSLRRVDRPRRHLSDRAGRRVRRRAAGGATCSSDLGADDVEEELLVRHRTSPRAADRRRGRRGHHRTQLAGARGGRGRRGDRPARAAAGDRDVPAAFMTGLGPGGRSRSSPCGRDPRTSRRSPDSLVLVAQGELFGVLVKHHSRPAAAGRARGRRR